MQSLSAKVLDRIRKRRERRVSIICKYAYCVSLLCVFTYGIHSANRKINMDAAPTWASFAAAGDLHETVLDTYPTGVPSEITVNGERWSVVPVDHFKDAEKHVDGETFSGVQAQTYCKNKTIAYIMTKDPSRLRVNIMHEVFHAGACLHGGDTWWNSEKPTTTVHPGIYHLGEFTANFMKDNPQFAVWLSTTERY